jgi:ComF family protein
MNFKKFISDIIFPKICFGCQKEGTYLCQDCQSVLEISETSFCLCQEPIRLPEPGKCRKCRQNNLNGLYFAVPYRDVLAKKLIHQFKYEPYVKELSESLASLIINHFQLIQKSFEQEKFILVPVPLTKKKLKQRGFNQSEEIAKEISKSLKLPLTSGCLFKEKETLSQMSLSAETRRENVKGVFSLKNGELIKDKKILLVDDVYTTGSTMEECAKILKEAGGKEVWGVAVARGE